MPLLNFQSRFAPLVESGEKRQTIRAYRKDGRDPKVGDRLFLYTGARTRQCRKLGEATCSGIREVAISYGWGLKLNRRSTSLAERRAFALADGFQSTDYYEPFGAMCKWFENTHGLPFRGLLIEWTEIER